MKFKRNDRVERVTGGYTFPGIVLGRATKLDGETDLYLIEADPAAGKDFAGLTHIFREADLLPRRDRKGLGRPIPVVGRPPKPDAGETKPATKRKGPRNG